MSTTSRRPTAKLRKWRATRTPPSALAFEAFACSQATTGRRLDSLQFTCTSSTPPALVQSRSERFLARSSSVPRLFPSPSLTSMPCQPEVVLHPTRIVRRSAGAPRPACRLFRWGGRLKVRPRRWFGASTDRQLQALCKLPGLQGCLAGLRDGLAGRLENAATGRGGAIFRRLTNSRSPSRRGGVASMLASHLARGPYRAANRGATLASLGSSSQPAAQHQRPPPGSSRQLRRPPLPAQRPMGLIRCPKVPVGRSRSSRGCRTF